MGESGSSPLARGLRRDHLPAQRIAGIIPARAGFTSNFVLLFWKWEDHPRSRGVYSATCERMKGCSGSSPLARGLQRLESGVRVVLGIIPARAGFTMEA